MKILLLAVSLCAGSAGAVPASVWTDAALPVSWASAPDLIELPRAWHRETEQLWQRSSQANTEFGACLSFTGADAWLKERTALGDTLWQARKKLLAVSRSNDAAGLAAARSALGALIETARPPASLASQIKAYRLDGVVQGKSYQVRIKVCGTLGTFHTHPDVDQLGDTLVAEFSGNDIRKLAQEPQSHYALIRHRHGYSLILKTEVRRGHNEPLLIAQLLREMMLASVAGFAADQPLVQRSSPMLAFALRSYAFVHYRSGPDGVLRKTATTLPFIAADGTWLREHPVYTSPRMVSLIKAVLKLRGHSAAPPWPGIDPDMLRGLSTLLKRPVTGIDSAVIKEVFKLFVDQGQLTAGLEVAAEETKWLDGIKGIGKPRSAALAVERVSPTQPYPYRIIGWSSPYEVGKQKDMPFQPPDSKKSWPPQGPAALFVMTVSDEGHTWQWCEGVVDKAGGSGVLEQRSLVNSSLSATGNAKRIQSPVTPGCASK